MKQNELYVSDNSRVTYVTPTVKVISIKGDIITESHFDPNMGEWDTEA